MSSNFDALKAEFEAYFAAHIKTAYLDLRAQNLIHEAIAYVLEGKGKRVRALFHLLCAHVFDVKKESAFAVAAALEMIHAYSLVHDDLPSMDNDDQRRGRPTAHKIYGEAQALLVGDALLTDAFAVLATVIDGAHDGVKFSAIFKELASAIGSRGMVEGQSLDIAWTNRAGATLEILETIHQKKTGMLFGACFSLAGLVVGVSTHEAAALRQYGIDIGLAFQIADDLIDNEHGTGKTKGKDEIQGKLTFLSFFSREQAREYLENKKTQAQQKLSQTFKDKDFSEIFHFSDMILAKT